jgi:hypothetical protein
MSVEGNDGNEEEEEAAASGEDMPLPCPVRHHLCLGNGTLLSFTKEEVSDPPAVSFADNIPLLVRTWDDTSDDWNPDDCVLHIQGQPIAVIHWREVYIYGKKGQWKGIQNRWTDWQVCHLFLLVLLTSTEPETGLSPFPLSTLSRAIGTCHLMGSGRSGRLMGGV